MNRRSPDSQSLPLKKRRKVDKESPGSSSDTTINSEPVPPSPSSPFFLYKDRSKERNDDALTPLVPMARVPTFPAKIYSILAHEDFSDIISWMPHGRSWKIHNLPSFEQSVLPKFFEHSRITSFIRQANGWGFRRITKGPNRDSYYHEYFLRGVPHLWKAMCRPGIANKQTIDPDHEPDLDAISELCPLPACTKAAEITAIFNCTMKGGPKARMPICPEASLSESVPESSTMARSAPSANEAPTQPAPQQRPNPPIFAQQVSGVPQQALNQFASANSTARNGANDLSVNPALMQLHQMQSNRGMQEALRLLQQSQVPVRPSPEVQPSPQSTIVNEALLNVLRSFSADQHNLQLLEQVRAMVHPPPQPSNQEVLLRILQEQVRVPPPVPACASARLMQPPPFHGNQQIPSQNDPAASLSFLLHLSNLLKK